MKTLDQAPTIEPTTDLHNALDGDHGLETLNASTKNVKEPTTSGPLTELAGRKLVRGCTVLIPAYNEEASIADTVRSVQAQSVQPVEIIVIDDCSKDRTGEIARSLGATVVRPEQNRGSKASALNYGMRFVKSDLVLTIDADTTLATDAIENLLPAMEDEKVGAASGFVVPRHVRTIWERGRYVEYLYAFAFYKPIQDYYRKPLIASGCFAIYRTDDVLQLDGWSHRTVGEDMDLTWTLYERGRVVRYAPGAVCYPIEPHNFHFLRKQLTRWSHGFVQCLKVHWRDLWHVPYLRMIVATALWDATIAAMAFIVVIPLLAIFVHPLFLLSYLVDLPSVVVPVTMEAARRGEVRKALACIPAFYVLRFVNFYFVLSAFFHEFVSGKRLKTFEKGH
jgi:poly-beta-1,6-N-acetyl-D-glucosamine synthase